MARNLRREKSPGMYSPSNMRWLTMDPLCEKYYSISPYAYCAGDPVNRIDPDGMAENRDRFGAKYLAYWIYAECPEGGNIPTRTLQLRFTEENYIRLGIHIIGYLALNNMRLLIICLIFSYIVMPLYGQKCRIILEDGTVDTEYDPSWPPIGGMISSFRIIYDRYPISKDELLRFLVEHRDHNLFYPYGLNVKDKTMYRIVKNRKNMLLTRGDSCSFFVKNLNRKIPDGDRLDNRSGVYYRHTKGVRNITYKFVGGPADYQSSDYQVFLAVTKMRCFDENGTFVGYLYQNAPTLDFDNQRKFRYRVVFEGDFAKDTTSSRQITYYPPVMIPITMNRSGKFIYDLSHVKGWHFYYRDYPSSIHGVLGDIKLEDAIDQDYINTIKSHLTEFLKQHPEVETIKTWEYLLFNDPPKEGSSASHL